MAVKVKEKRGIFEYFYIIEEDVDGSKITLTNEEARDLLKQLAEKLK